VYNNITDHEKDIYNCYLKFSRNLLPYNPRKDFTKINYNTVVFLKKLNAFFTKFPHIKKTDFFYSPIALHPDEKYPDLSFFITRAAIKSYSVYMKKRLSESPENQFEHIKESIHFVAMFCLKNSIKLEDYINQKTINMPTWMQHYREYRVNPYVLLELGNVSSFKYMEEDEKSIWAGDFFDNVNSFVTRYHNSQKAKSFIKEGLSRVENFLKKELYYQK
jgi:hypothetical protein